MEKFFWIFSGVSIAAVLAIIFGIFIFTRGKEKHKPDYYSFFLVGAVWFLIGIVSREQPLLFLGAVFTIVGIWNRDKWKENRKDWRDLNREERKIKTLITFLSLLFVLGGFAIYFCIAEGYLL